jgi:hypothetical protein
MTIPTCGFAGLMNTRSVCYLKKWTDRWDVCLDIFMGSRAGSLLRNSSMDKSDGNLH